MRQRGPWSTSYLQSSAASLSASPATRGRISSRRSGLISGRATAGCCSNGTEGDHCSTMLERLSKRTIPTDAIKDCPDLPDPDDPAQTAEIEQLMHCLEKREEPPLPD